MALYVKAYCKNCDSTFDIYGKEMSTELKMSCPHCFQKIDDAQRNRLEDAFFTVQNLLTHTKKSHEERGTGLFLYDFVSIDIAEDKLKV